MCSSKRARLARRRRLSDKHPPVETVPGIIELLDVNRRCAALAAEDRAFLDAIPRSTRKASFWRRLWGWLFGRPPQLRVASTPKKITWSVGDATG